MRLSTVFVLICLIAACVSAEDSAGKSDFPAPPEAVNACLSDNQYLFFDQRPPEGQANIELLVYVKDIQNYTTIVEGDWEKHWYRVSCDIIRKAVGQWEDKELNFVCFDTWPTAESGIKAKKRIPFSYLKGRIFYFWIQKKSPLPLILTQKQRSPVAPYEDLNRMMVNFKDPVQKETYYKIAKAASEVVKNSTNIIDEREDCYIVESAEYENHIGKVSYVKVDKATLKASVIPLFGSAGQEKSK